jgi:hypothetical protein
VLCEFLILSFVRNINIHGNYLKQNRSQEDMNSIRSTAYVLAILIMVGCVATRTDSNMATQNSQRMATTFKRDGVKLEWSCRWGTGVTKATCVKGDFIGIEVTAYAPSFGTTEATRESAFRVANDMALGKLAQFLSTEINTSRTTKILTRNVEKTNQMLLSGKAMPTEVATNDDESATRNGSNEQALQVDTNVASSVVETIKIQSQRILKGVRAIDEKIVDAKTVSVTVRWDTQSDSARQQIDKAMSR